jgi:hypothetical protein
MMRFRSTAAWWSGLATFWAHAAGAQSAIPAAQGFSASVGVLESARIDETASPVRYAGYGADFTLGWSRTFAQYSVDATIEGGTRALSPLEGSESASERLTEGSLSVSLLRTLAGATARSDFRAGIRVDGLSSIVEHTYPTVELLRSDYLFAAASLGPAAAWGRTFAGGWLNATIGIPLVALVDHPFTDIRNQGAPLAFRAVSAASYRAVNGGVSFTSTVSRKVGIVYGYRIGVLHYDDEQPVRAVTQSVSVGVVRIVGSRRP